MRVESNRTIDGPICSAPAAVANPAGPYVIEPIGGGAVGGGVVGGGAGVTAGSAIEPISAVP